MKRYAVLFCVVGVAASFAAMPSWASPLVPDDPGVLAKTTSLGKLLATQLDRPLHIVYVHGMRAEGPGASNEFRAGLCRYTAGLCAGHSPTPERRFLSLGPKPDVWYTGTEEIWRTDAEWEASRPFVDRYVYPRKAGQPVIVDEVNWWPLLFPPKCRLLLVPEASLSGADSQHLHLCARREAPYYPWLREQDVDAILSRRPTSGGGALLNRRLKQQIMNWGLSDAVLALGPLRRYFREAISRSFDYVAQFDSRSIADQEFVVISESLGSFVVLDAFGHGESARAREVGERTADLYFFANQFALLELARVEIKQHPDQVNFEEGADVPSDLLHEWATSGVRAGVVSPRPKQLIAFSDGSDLLTYPVPRIRDKQDKDLALVVNVYDRNEIRWLGLIANPIKAHTGHSSNKEVLKLILRQ